MALSLLRRFDPSRVAGIACGALAVAAAPTFALPALAQTVQIFDEAPSIEQLRSIMIPESKPGVGRTIVLQRPDSGVQPAEVQRASTQIQPVQRRPTAAAAEARLAVQQAASSVPAAAVPSPAKPAAAAGAGTVGFHINFAFDSDALPESAHAMIDRVAQVMREAPDMKVRVEGHTDAIGSADYNVALSERRALSVAQYLVRQGVEPSRLQLIGKGMAEPYMQNRYDPANRRVQFVRVG